MSIGWPRVVKFFCRGFLLSGLLLVYLAAAQTVAEPLSALPQMRVNLNTADQGQLEVIKYIGPTLATRILRERQQHGLFQSFEDLQRRVSGIGAGKLKQLQDAGLTLTDETYIPVQPGAN